MIVSKDGNGDFKSVQQAIDSMVSSNRHEIIHIRNGIYKEKIHITKPGITLKGESSEKTILTFDDYARKPFDDGEEMGTFHSYSILVAGEGFKAENITFENTAGSGKIKGQAIAAYVDADRVHFRNCRFLGHQDTLYTGPLPPKPMLKNGFKGPSINPERLVGRQFYEHCYIEGDIDFIFGSAMAVFKDCTIKSLDMGAEKEGLNGYITAASTPSGSEFGYVFIHCSLESECAPKTVYLGRPWRNYAQTVFINCSMGEHIKEEGWHNWNKADSEKTVFYAEYQSRGPGGNINRRVPWAKILTEEEAKKYQIEQLFNWI